MTSDSPDFLVIVPTYRRPAFLLQALESVLAQPGVSKRIVVIDDCPQGSAQAAVAGLDPSVTYLRNPTPSGGWPAKVRNFGFEVSLKLGIVARFVHFLDDDDTVPHGHYQRVVQAFAAHPGIGVVFGITRPFCVFEDDTRRRARQRLQLDATRREFAHKARLAWIYHHVGATLKLGFLSRWLYRNHAIFGTYLFLCSGAIIRHEQVKRLGGFDPRIRITEDYEFFTRAILAGGVHFLERPSANYRLGSAEALWSPLELSQQEEIHRDAEVRYYMTRRYLELQSKVGILRFRAEQAAFGCLACVLDIALTVASGFETLLAYRRASRTTRLPSPPALPWMP